jgi:phospholipase/carboxylesterase
VKAGGRPQPTLVVLHGYANRPGDMLALVDELSTRCPEPEKRLLTGPVRLGAGPDGSARGFAWWDEEGMSGERSTVDDAVTWLRRRLEGPSILIGFSQGAALAVATAAVPESQVVGVVAISGFVPDGVLVQSLRVPLLIVHGEADEVVDLMFAERLERQARAAGCAVSLHVHDGGHVIPEETGAWISDWLNQPEGSQQVQPSAN